MSNPAIAARMGELIANESVQKALAVAKEEAPRALAEQIAIAQILPRPLKKLAAPKKSHVFSVNTA